MNRHHNTSGLILAGGKAQRMGGNDKGLIELNGRAMIEHVIDGLQPQVQTILINANRNVDTYKKYGFKVLEDRLEDFQGPLAGFASGMEHCKTDYIATVPCDGPFISPDYVDRLHKAVSSERAMICVADDGHRLQPVYALIHTSLLDSLMKFLATGDRKIDRWYESVNFAKADFSDVAEMFTNVNTPKELDEVGLNLSGQI
ncbi:MAG: molybdenum cofactor guanylyltransferase MobA [Pseudomonadota bacterium]